MAVEVKICGLSTPESLRAAVGAGAAYVGFNFFPPSPRAVTPAEAAVLTPLVPDGVIKTGLFVDPEDDDIAAVLAVAQLDLLQLHGGETPDRLAALRKRFGIPIMKVVKLRDRDDLTSVADYFEVADRLLFDPKAPEGMIGALPGGNAVSFDWGMLAGCRWPLPWMLAGGLTTENLGEAVKVTAAPTVDVSSGVETAPGVKDPAKITAFLAAAKAL
jgi:phosphoribosylanthranilate isomerase